MSGGFGAGHDPAGQGKPWIDPEKEKEAERIARERGLGGLPISDDTRKVLRKLRKPIQELLLYDRGLTPEVIVDELFSPGTPGLAERIRRLLGLGSGPNEEQLAWELHYQGEMRKLVAKRAREAARRDNADVLVKEDWINWAAGRDVLRERRENAAAAESGHDVEEVMAERREEASSAIHTVKKCPNCQWLFLGSLEGPEDEICIVCQSRTKRELPILKGHDPWRVLGRLSQAEIQRIVQAMEKEREESRG